MWVYLFIHSETNAGAPFLQPSLEGKIVPMHGHITNTFCGVQFSQVRDNPTVFCVAEEGYLYIINNGSRQLEGWFELKVTV